MMLDQQITRVCSITADINHLLFVSSSATLRKYHLEFLLQTYFDTYTSLISRAGLKIPFTFEEFKKEFKLRNPYGFIIGIFMLSFVALEREDLLEFDKIEDKDEAARQTDKQSERVIEIFRAGGIFKDKFLALIDDLILSHDSSDCK